MSLKLKPQWAITIPLSEWLKYKTATGSNADENVEKLDHSQFAGGNVIRRSHSGKHFDT